jgi:hypothetical protein
LSVALEVLVAELLGRDWIYHEHRMATGREFDVDIWKRFGRRCSHWNLASAASVDPSRK